MLPVLIRKPNVRAVHVVRDGTPEHSTTHGGRSVNFAAFKYFNEVTKAKAIRRAADRLHIAPLGRQSAAVAT